LLVDEQGLSRAGRDQLRGQGAGPIEDACELTPGKELQDDPRVHAIAEAARDLVAKRDAWLNPPGASEAELKKRTLTHLYNQRPPWLDLAHRKLDAAVLDAYGWPHELGAEDILARLLALNLERSGRA